MSIINRKRSRTKIASCIAICLFILLIGSRNENEDDQMKNSILQPSIVSHLQINDHLPKLARTVYLILCENQTEVDAFTLIFPSSTADVIYFCWRTPCQVSSHLSKRKLFVDRWPHLTGISIQPQAFVINEVDLNLTQRTTWTTARNLLLERALEEEHHQGWRWAYFNFLDGDVRLDCPLAKEILNGSMPQGDAMMIVQPFLNVINQKINEDQCFLLFDIFLLTISPAIGTVANTGPTLLFPALLAQIVYHIDAMLNAFHRDAIALLLPYCSRYDRRSWWSSQAILMYRSICVYGHSLQFNAISVNRQIHRPYPRHGDPFLIHQDMNLVPKTLIHLKEFMKRERTVSALILEHYPGWSFALTSQECQEHHTHVNLETCRVIDA